MFDLCVFDLCPQCENCRMWWHRACAGHGGDPGGDLDKTFYCTSCQHRIALTQGGGEEKTVPTESAVCGPEVMEEDTMDAGGTDAVSGVEFDEMGEGREQEGEEKELRVELS